jgi:putative DNA primase/helicase
MLDAALNLAASGWSVFPCRESGPQNKAPYTSDGFKNATTDPDQIRAWWTRWPNALIGLAIPEGVTVFDVDPRNGGDLQNLEDLGVPFNTLTTISGRGDGGCHKWVQTPPDFKPRSYNLPAGIDTRVGGKHYVIGAPSLHPDTGQPYTWAHTDAGMAALPAETIERLQAPRQPQPASQPAQAQPMATVTQLSPVAQILQGPEYEDDPDSITPLDDFERQVDFKDLLEPAGWKLWSTNGRVREWTRPGKPGGVSATTGLDPDRERFYPFTSSTEFEPETPYTKQGVYAVLHHNGDHSAAARALRKQGYGSPRKPKARNTTTASQNGAQQPVTTADGNNPSLRPSGQTHMAYRLEDQYANRIKYAGGVGWHVWDNTRWARDTKDRAKLAVLNVLKKALAESLNDEQLRKDVRAVERSASGINGVLDIASALPQLRVAVEDLDADPYLLNTKTGTLDLRTFELNPHNPDDRITKVTGTGYDPNATAPTWDAFLASSLPDPEVRAFLQRYVGQALIGRVLEQVLVIATGEGRNGKGVIARTLAEVLGDYAITANNHMLVAGRYKQQSAGEQASLMRLRGARWADMSELEKGDRLAESTMKSLTGGDTIEAKFMHSNPVEFRPSHSFFMLTNDLPKVDADDHAVWARMLVIPFNVSFKGREDHTLEDRLKLELAGILTWAVQGLADYQQQGLNPPEAVLAKTNVYRYDNDAFAQFISDRCVIEPNQSITRKQLNIEHHNWAINNGVEALSAKEMVAKVKGLEGVSEATIRGTRLWKGLGVKIEQPELD